MKLRVDTAQDQGRWREGQTPWDLGHQKKKHCKNRTSAHDDVPVQEEQNGSLYDSKGSLILPVSSLKISI